MLRYRSLSIYWIFIQLIIIGWKKLLLMMNMKKNYYRIIFNRIAWMWKKLRTRLMICVIIWIEFRVMWSILIVKIITILFIVLVIWIINTGKDLVRRKNHYNSSSFLLLINLILSMIALILKIISKIIWVATN